MKEHKWISLSSAAKLIDVSVDTILRRSIDYEGDLGEGTRQDHRYHAPDALSWLN
jgi:hypothetical protein